MEKKKRKVVALRHTAADAEGNLAAGAERFVEAMVLVVAGLVGGFNTLITGLVRRQRDTAYMLLRMLGWSISGNTLLTATLDPPPEETKRGIRGAVEMELWIKNYRFSHPGAGVAAVILASPMGVEYMRKKGEALLLELKQNTVGDTLLVGSENGVTALALAAMGKGYDIGVVGGDFRFVEGVCITLDEHDNVTDVQILRNSAFNS